MTKMKAVRWEGKPFSVSVRNIPVPKIVHPEDAIVRITSSAICGSDLHFYHGRYNMAPETVGHENMGIVVEVGSGVANIKKGDRVVVNCVIEEPLDNGNDEGRGTFGYGITIGGSVDLQQGGQAEYMRVPFAAQNLLIVPAGTQNELDYLLLADIWPTAWWALDRAEQVISDTVAVFGAGPVGLLCAYSALLRGAVRVYVVDRVPERLAMAKKIGAIPINFVDVDPVAEILKHEPGGVDRSCECVGYECVDRKGDNVESTTIKWAIAVTRFYGGIGLIGVFLPSGADPKDANGSIPDFPMGDFFFKGLSLKTGGVDTRQFQNTLKVLIESGKAKPSFVFEKKFNIKDANKAYKTFSDRKIIKGYFSFDSDHFGASSISSALEGDDGSSDEEPPVKVVGGHKRSHGHANGKEVEEPRKVRKIQRNRSEYR